MALVRCEFDLRFPITYELYAKFKHIQYQRKLKSNELINNLLLQTETPKNYQKDYNPEPYGVNEYTFEQRVTEKVFLSFNLLAVFFKTKANALNYLMKNEKKNEGVDTGLSNSDYTDSS